MLVENQPETPSRRALKAGARTVFMKVWPVLKSLPQMGAAFCFESSIMAGHVDGEVRRAVGEGHAFAQRGVGVDLRGRDADVVVLEALLERLDGLRGPAVGSMKISVEPHQIITTRSTVFLKA